MVGFAASVVGSAAGATAMLALFIKITHFVQTKATLGPALKAMPAKIHLSGRVLNPIGIDAGYKLQGLRINSSEMRFLLRFAMTGSILYTASIR